MRLSHLGVPICLSCENHDAETRELYAGKHVPIDPHPPGMDPETRHGVNFFIQEVLSEGGSTIETMYFSTVVALNAERRILLRMFEQTPRERWADLVHARIGKEMAREPDA